MAHMASERVPSPLFPINRFTTAEAAGGDALRLLKKGAGFYVWSTADGLFDWTAVAVPSGRDFRDAQLVSHGHVPGRADPRYPKCGCAVASDGSFVASAWRDVEGVALAAKRLEEDA